MTDTHEQRPRHTIDSILDPFEFEFKTTDGTFINSTLVRVYIVGKTCTIVQSENRKERKSLRILASVPNNPSSSSSLCNDENSTRNTRN